MHTLITRLAEIFSAPGWLKACRPGWLRGDTVAGSTLAAYLMPAGIGLQRNLQTIPAKHGIGFHLAEARSRVRHSLRRAGFENHYGPITPDQTIDTILQTLHNPPVTTHHPS